MKKNILFVGNSYTYFNDMPERIFATMAGDAGYKMEVRSVTCGGYHLSWFADPENEEGKRLRAVVDGRHFDCIVLQDHSLSTILDPGDFFGGIRRLQQLLGAYTDRFILYATWGRKTGCETLVELGMTNEEMTRHIAEAYDEAGRRFEMSVSHVGKAFAAHSGKFPEDELYDADLHHPSELGSTVAAKTILDTYLSVL